MFEISTVFLIFINLFLPSELFGILVFCICSCVETIVTCSVVEHNCNWNIYCCYREFLSSQQGYTFWLCGKGQICRTLCLELLAGYLSLKPGCRCSSVAAVKAIQLGETIPKNKIVVLESGFVHGTGDPSVWSIYTYENCNGPQHFI
jgi:hypothetical protein